MENSNKCKLTDYKISITILAVVISFMVFLNSCSYSVIVSVKEGVAEPDPMRSEVGFYMGKQVNEIDTVVALSLVQDGVMVVQSCPGVGLHSVEYKITFGDMLRNTFTFGKRKGVKVKYVCIKNSNQ